jgi:ATP-dependent Clp protease ATP-binding subunit ClpC
MFERYTEKARRIVFFARYEASQFGSPWIETEHLLLGILREDKVVAERFILKTMAGNSIRRRIEARTVLRESIATSVDLPLSNESKRALAYAAEEAARLSDKHIGPEHLLLGLLRETNSFAAELLRECSLTVESVREELKREAVGSRESLRPDLVTPIRGDLTELASRGRLHAFVGREKEMDRLIHLLERSSKNNVVLVGEPGVGKRAMAEGLAQRIVSGNVPSSLANQKIFDFNLSQIADPGRGKLKHLLYREETGADYAASPTPREPKPLARRPMLCFIEGAFSLLASASVVNLPPAGEKFKALVMDRDIQSICPATPAEYRNAKKQHGWLSRMFSTIEVLQMTEPEAVAVLSAAKARLEDFHSVLFGDEVIADIVRYSSFFVKDRNLPDKALDLMDEAAAYAKSSRERQIPDEVRETQKHIRFIAQRLESALAGREFEKARFYSDEERKERERLRELSEKHKITGQNIDITREDIQQVLSQWTGVSVNVIKQGPPSGGGQNPIP